MIFPLAETLVKLPFNLNLNYYASTVGYLEALGLDMFASAIDTFEALAASHNASLLIKPVTIIQLVPRPVAKCQIARGATSRYFTTQTKTYVPAHQR